MLVVAAVVGLVFVALVWVGADHAVTRWTRLPRAGAWSARVLLGVILVGALLAVSLGRSMPAGSAWRPVVTIGLSLVAWLFYVFLGLAVLAVINAVWRLVGRLLRTGKPAGAGDRRAQAAGQPTPARVQAASAGGQPAPAGDRRAQAAGQPAPAGAPATPAGGQPAPAGVQAASAGGQPTPADGRRIPAGPSTDWRQGFLRWAVVVVVVASTLVTSFGVVAARQPRLTDVTLTAADLPAAFAGFRIALITDVHAGPGVSQAFVDRLVDQVNAARPDLIVIAGDLVEQTVARTGSTLDALSRLEAPYGTVVTTGNHEFLSGDVDAWLARWRAQGLTVLDNSGLQLTRAGVSIDVLGIDDAQGGGAHAPDLRAAAAQLAATFGTPGDGAGRFRVLVAHEPRQASADDDLAARLGVDVQLSGHTHGGQLWPFGYAVRLQQPVIAGVQTVGGVTVVTSRGAGTWGPPVRVLADPEVVLVTLRPA